MRLLLLPFSFLYILAISFRNLLYNLGALKTHKVNVPVLSVGNLTVGGTGKTPFVMHIIQFLLEKQKKIAVLYHSSIQKDKQVGEGELS